MTTKMQCPMPHSSASIRNLLGLAKGQPLPPVLLLAHVTDQATGEALFDIGFKTETGHWRCVRISKELVRHHPMKVRDMLSKYDAALPRDAAKVDEIMKDLARADAPSWWQLAPTLGWQVDGRAFALHDRMIGMTGSGKSAKKSKLIPPDRGSNFNMAVLRENGELEGWKKGVAAAAHRSSAVTLALCTAFAAPLLSIISWPTFMVVLCGPGKVGKSTAALAAASLLGIGDEKDLPNWNITGPALAELACCYNDLPLILNGLESTKLKDKELRDFLKSVTYILGDGIETRRHSSWAAANGSRGPATWRTIALVTSEQSFDELARRANDTRLEGERARAINVAAIAPGSNTIVDWYSKTAPKDPDERDAWSRKKVEALRAACAEHHGVALKPYVEYLIAQDKDELQAEIHAARDKFVDAVRELATTGALNHAAKNMGVIYAGGLQAIKSELLTLNEEQLLRRLKRCFKRSFQPAAHAPCTLTNSLKLLDQGLTAAIKGADTSEFSGLIAIAHTPQSAGQVEIVVHSTKLFNRWFGDDGNARSAALRWLFEKGFLEAPDKAEAIRAGFTIASVRHTRRITGKNCATIVFRDPRAALTAELNPKT